MDELVLLKKCVSSIKEASISLGKMADEFKESKKAINIAVFEAEKLLADIKIPAGLHKLKDDRLVSIDKLLRWSFHFKPTSVIADHLRQKSPEFIDLNNMQIGKLLAKHGFKSGHDSKSRGYYVKYTEL